MVFGFLRRWWPLAGVAVLLTLAAVAAAHSSVRLGRVESPAGPAPSLEEPERIRVEPSETAEPFAAASVTVPSWLVKLVVAIGIVLLAVLIGMMVWVLARDLVKKRRMRAMPARRARPGQTSAQDVVAALDAGLVDLSDADSDPRRAVIACWLRLEQAAAAAGTPRQATDTPTDLVTRLLAGHHISADVLARFADVYREARYATHTVDERMRTQAREALQRLRAELTAGAVHE
ncbi:DUF4129 domain-containing protein [Phytohabitans aurantiacus]|jgi:hypothetical protein|uniref:Protein-glutamine gamma-glutamyltransferase-like C-terminal domain-containing protein n=1 Tax=Phytohabitans aurantiacus TaxID=3016789 RepID=A0ABQ5QYJ4_9ACTN|nr:hypothetical protein Pa4123_36900 [Phytohabitans aurantiacus]